MLRGICLSAFAVLLLYSCTPTVSAIYGIKPLRMISDESVVERSKRLGIPSDRLFKLDSLYFKSIEAAARSTGNSQSGPDSRFMQPLQVMYFLPDGKLVSAHSNCVAGGFPNLAWNKSGAFDQWIPTSSLEIAPEVTLERMKKHIQPLSNIAQSIASDTTVFVFYSHFMGRQSKRLIELVQKNARLSGRDAEIYYVNTDDAFLYYMR